MCEHVRRADVKREGRVFVLRVLVLAVLISGCGDKPTSLADVLPGRDAVPNWVPAGEVQAFERDNLYDLVDGQADAFFAYGFEQVAVRGYEHAGDIVDVEVWQLATDADAYGLFTANISGAPVTVGNAGDGDPGRRLALWQSRYYVVVRARQELDDAILQDFAEAISRALASGGQRPALVDRLPSEGVVERSERFFHEEISIQNDLWLGGQNLLGLSPETSGVLARYDIDGSAARLLLVQYPNMEGAAAGLAALETAEVGGLVTAGAHDEFLGAVFGQVDKATADALLAEALQ